MTPADAAAETLCIMPVGADAAEAACTVTRQSITHCCVLDHANDAAILTAWLANKTPENLAAWIAAPGAAAWGAYRGETMVGFALRAQATLALCYVVPDALHRGWGGPCCRTSKPMPARRGSQRWTWRARARQSPFTVATAMCRMA